MQSSRCGMAMACLLSGWLSVVAAAAQTMILPKEPPNLGKLETELREYHDCKGNHGCYTTDLNRETAEATADLEQAVRQNQAPGKRAARLAVVLDIDETSLSNWPEIAQADFAYNGAVWNRWVDEAAAPAIRGTLRFYQEAEKLGVAVFFITGRPESQRLATEKNLHAQGYGRWAGLILRSTAEAKTPTITYKSAARERIVREGYRIAVNMGDQMSDLEGAPQAALSVKLSDPFYFIP